MLNQISLISESRAIDVLKQVSRQIGIQEPFCSYQESVGFELSSMPVKS